MGKSESNAAFWMKQKEFPKAKQRPQDVYPEFLKYRRQLNTSPTPTRSNTDVEKILAFKPSPWLFEPLEIQSKAFPVVAESAEQFEKMMGDITKQKVIAVDFEEHQLHSYLGMQVYMQVSTVKHNYLIFLPSCFNLMNGDMRAVLESKSVVKLLHGGDNDILHLQRDFGIYARAVVDTQHVYNYVYGISEKGFKIGFKMMSNELLKATYPVDFDSSMQLADWRIHPLPYNMKMYAMYDSYLLLKCWNLLRVNLMDGSYED